MENKPNAQIVRINSVKEYKELYFPNITLLSTITSIIDSTDNLGTVFANDTLKIVEEILTGKKEYQPEQITEEAE